MFAGKESHKLGSQKLWEFNIKRIEESLDAIDDSEFPISNREWLKKNKPFYLEWIESESAYYKGLIDRKNDKIMESDFQMIIDRFEQAFKKWRA